MVIPICYSRPGTFTLGLGVNTIHILLVDMTHTEPWVLITVTLHITRLTIPVPDSLALQLEASNPGTIVQPPHQQISSQQSDYPSHKVCSLRQVRKTVQNYTLLFTFFKIKQLAICSL